MPFSPAEISPPTEKKGLALRAIVPSLAAVLQRLLLQRHRNPNHLWCHLAAVENTVSIVNPDELLAKGFTSTFSIFQSTFK